MTIAPYSKQTSNVITYSYSFLIMDFEYDNNITVLKIVVLATSLLNRVGRLRKVLTDIIRKLLLLFESKFEIILKIEEN